MRALFAFAILIGLSITGSAVAASPCPPHAGGLDLPAVLTNRRTPFELALPDLAGGLKNERVQPYVYFGKPAYSQTSTVWIEVKPKNAPTEYCTGVLVGAHWILSAAHCIVTDSSIQIGFGPSFNSKATSDASVRTKILDVVLPEDFDKNGLRVQPGRDLVLLKIGNVDICSDYRQPSPVVRLGAYLKEPTHDLWAVGYGLTEQNEYGEKRMTKLSPVTSTCTTPLARKSECVPFKEFIASDTLGSLNPGVGGDTCSGDSGGPLFNRLNGKMYLVGITSRGLDRFGHPSSTCGYGGIYSFAGGNTVLKWLKTHVTDLQVVE